MEGKKIWRKIKIKFKLRGCIGLGILMIFIEFDIFLKTSIDFCRICKCMYDFHKLLF